MNRKEDYRDMEKYHKACQRQHRRYYRLMEISEYIRTRNRHLKILSAKPYRRIAV